MYKKVFILGGTKSGKSDFALQRANQLDGPRAFIATAQSFDSEMAERIKKHKQQRGQDGWDTYEEPLELSNLLLRISDKYQVIIVDCLTLWLNNLIADSKTIDFEQQFSQLTNTLKNLNGHSGQDMTRIFIVSNEVGMGIVPDNPLARQFRDLAGRLNRMIAEVSDHVYLVYAGLPLLLKD